MDSPPPPFSQSFLTSESQQRNLFNVGAGKRSLTDLGFSPTRECFSSAAKKICKPGHGASAVFGRKFTVDESQTELLEIEVPRKLIFVKIVEKMGSLLPRFNCKNIRDTSFQMDILFEVPASYTSMGCIDPVKVTGSVSPTEEIAEASALTQAFNYLSDTHKILVMDYSGRLVEEYKEEAPSIYPTAVKFSEAVETMGDLWGRGLYGVGSLVAVFRGKALSETKDGNLSESGKVYDVYLTCIGKKSREQHTEMLELFRKYNAVRQECTQAAHELSEKGDKKFVCFSEKDVLAYLLNYMGLPEAEYYNKPKGRFVYTGYAAIDLPLVDNIPCSGRTIMKGNMKSTAARESDDAAGKAIGFIEENYKLSVKDANCTERVAEKARIDYLRSLESKFNSLAHFILEKWQDIITQIGSYEDVYE